MWNISNILSLSRIFFSIPLVYFILDDNTLMIILITTIAMATDYLDGYYARKLNQITELGKILDPLADKIIISSVIAAMVFAGKVHPAFAVAVVLRDLMILAGGLYTRKVLGYVIPSNKLGKWTVTLLSYYLIFKLLVSSTSVTFSIINSFSIIVVSAMMAASLISYVIGARRLIRNKQNDYKSV